MSTSDFIEKTPCISEGNFAASDFHRILSLEFPASCHNIAVIIKCFAGPPTLYIVVAFCVKNIDLHR